MFLTADELVRFTGYKQQSAQIRWLRAHGYAYDLNGVGHPIVPHSSLGIGATPAQHARSPALPRPELQSIERIAATRAPYRIGDGGDDAGIYFLWHDDGLLYIGLSVEVSARLRAHFMLRIDRPDRAIPFNAISVVPCPEHHLRDVERAYIRRERPPCNVRDNR